jgi:hypothetical protein
LQIVGDRISVLMPDVEHGKGLIDTDDPARLKVLGNRPRSPARAGSEIKHQFVAAQRQHFDHLVGERTSNACHGRAAVEFRGMRRIVEARLVVRLMAVIMAVFVAMRVMAMFVTMAVAASAVLVMIVATMFVIVLMFTCWFMRMAAPVSMIMLALMRVRLMLRMTVAPFVTARIFMIMLVLVIVSMLALVFVFVFVRHNFLLQAIEKGHLLRCARLTSHQRTRVRLCLSIFARSHLHLFESPGNKFSNTMFTYCFSFTAYA